MEFIIVDNGSKYLVCSGMYNVQCKLNIVQCTLFNRRCTEHSEVYTNTLKWKSVQVTVKYTVYTADCTKEHLMYKTVDIMNCDGAGVQQVYKMFEMNIGKEERTNT